MTDLERALEAAEGLSTRDLLDLLDCLLSVAHERGWDYLDYEWVRRKPYPGGANTEDQVGLPRLRADCDPGDHHRAGGGGVGVAVRAE